MEPALVQAECPSCHEINSIKALTTYPHNIHQLNLMKTAEDMTKLNDFVPCTNKQVDDLQPVSEECSEVDAWQCPA